MPTTTTRKTTTRKTTTRRRAVAKKPVAPTVEVVRPDAWAMRSPHAGFTGPEYFYDGEVLVTDGRVTIPYERMDWVKRLLMNDYSFVRESDLRFFDSIYEA